MHISFQWGGSGRSSVRKPVDASNPLALVVPLVFAVSSIGPLCFSAHLALANHKLLSSGRHTVGEVTNVESWRARNSDGNLVTRYRSTINFTTDYGQSLQITIGRNTKRGERLPLVYDPATPTAAKVNSFWDLWAGTAIGGAAFTILSGLSLGLFAAVIRRRKEIAWLKQHGELVEAEVVGINTKTERRHRRRHSHDSTYFEIVCRFSLNGRELTFLSENLTRYPGDHMIGKAIPVYIDRTDPSSYFVDTAIIR